jgi:hypothetical protein
VEPERDQAAMCDSFWVRAEYLLWWIRDSHFPPLLTSGSPTDALPGALGMTGTHVLFGGAVDSEEHSGARLTAGTWLGSGRDLGVEASYFFLAARSIGQEATGGGDFGSPVIARPFFDVLANREDASLVAFPGLIGGTAKVSAWSALQGAEANAVWRLVGSERGWLEALVGLRYLNLDEDLDIVENDQVNAAAPVFAGAAITVADHFDTRNNFFGAQAGLRALLRSDDWTFEAVAKVAVGDSHEVVDIFGSTSITPPGGPAQSSPGGLLALPSNSGRFSHDAFAVVPEVGLTVGYQVTRYLRAFAGYTFLYWSDVARPGDEIDRNINRQQVPTSRINGPLTGPAQPAFSFNQTDFWAQGVSVGLELRY